MLPIYIGVVDVTGCPDFIKTVQKSLYSIIDNLSDGKLNISWIDSLDYQFSRLILSIIPVD